ncbi:hypothetical protein RB614_35345 [Phytohabitans sp. ZYX-F-186]|uniref:Uncharacterized protein n=1 Tax=Phytohabitans maris TaxID=3071409 RepID=A0ABU0ZV29_9ACTN|nr:hypothetical protein [Phytohabitans sp. ZYX-F-186]MDQ7909787.1 hypothetical protein [Phytohabitans sp. ZYX-F-186]
MDVLVAGAADDDGLAAPLDQEADPGRPVMAVEVSELADVVHFDLVLATTGARSTRTALRWRRSGIRATSGFLA